MTPSAWSSFSYVISYGLLRILQEPGVHAGGFTAVACLSVDIIVAKPNGSHFGCMRVVFEQQNVDEIECAQGMTCDRCPVKCRPAVNIWLQAGATRPHDTDGGRHFVLRGDIRSHYRHCPIAIQSLIARQMSPHAEERLCRRGRALLGVSTGLKLSWPNEAYQRAFQNSDRGSHVKTLGRSCLLSDVAVQRRPLTVTLMVCRAFA